jgi:hypothetical protein
MLKHYGETARVTKDELYSTLLREFLESFLKQGHRLATLHSLLTFELLFGVCRVNSKKPKVHSRPNVKLKLN